ncbi:MAG: hypothetical protein GF350_05035 [Chitinivibrionales bacterium]|nr:hypothetical protein [Chitinivibrionales bacterium]
MQQGIDRLIHLTWGGRHSDRVAHVVLDPDLLVGENQTSSRNNHSTFAAANGFHAADNRIYFTCRLKEESSVTVSLFDPEGRKICSRSGTAQQGVYTAMLDAKHRKGVFLIRASVNGVHLASEKLVVK